jgi:hypothetical protein
MSHSQPHDSNGSAMSEKTAIRLERRCFSKEDRPQRDGRNPLFRKIIQSVELPGGEPRIP